MARKMEDIQRERQETIRLQREILDKAEKENRKLSDEEKERYDELEEDWKTLEAERRYLVRNPEYASWLGQSQREPIKPMPTGKSIDQEHRGDSTMQIENREEYEKAGRALLGLETRTMQKDLDTKGGFTVQNVFLSKTILKEMDNLVFIRKYATIFNVTNADRVGIPFMVTDMSDLSFTGEITSASLDSSMSFERREMMPKRLAKAIKVSKELESISAADFAAFIIGRGTYKAAAVEENSFLNGSGVGEPLGLFTVSENGCSASRNVTTGNTSTDLKADNLIETYHSLKSQYLQSSTLRWLFSRETLKKIRKMKDGEGNFLWSQGFGANPATVLGVPYVVSEYAPDTYTSGARVAALADLKFYGIAQRQADISVKVLDQLYALENCNAYLFQTWVDGMPLVEEAFSFCTLG